MNAMKKLLIMSAILMFVFVVITVACAFIGMDTNNDIIEQICTVGLYAAGPLAIVAALSTSCLVLLNLFKK